MSEPLLQTSGLVRAWGPQRVIDGLDLTVMRGQIYGFLGRNGAGKTTLIKMLLGILAPDAGTITLEGHRVRRVTPAMRARIGYVAQEQHFYDWMDARALGRFVGGFYPSWSPTAYARALERLVVPERRPAGQLSGGTRMKLAIALAIGAEPALLVLDEPTAGVDPVTRREVLDLLGALRDEGRTVLFSTHYVAEIEAVGDVVGVLHGGKLLYQGPPDGMRTDGGTLEDAFVAMVRT